ncbi:MAG: HlyD family secretion protein [Aureispira sp.]
MPEHEPTTEFTLVEQAMGNPPGWLTYWGITVIIVFLGVVLAITSMIQFPDTLKAEAITYIDKPPIELFSPRAGTVHALLVKEGDTVQPNIPLLVLESTADWKVVLQLEQVLQQQMSTNEVPLSSTKLGVLNNPYQELVLLEARLKDAHQNNITNKLTTGIRKEIEQNKTLNASLREQKKVFQKEINNLSIDLERAKKLLQEGALSQQEFEQKENTYFQSKRTLHQMESAIISNNINVQQLELQIPVSEKKQHDLLFNLETAFQQKKEQLQTAINQWKKTYILSAKSTGKIVLNNDLQEGAQLQPEQAYSTITPFVEDKKSYIKAKIEALGSGKITVGQKAIVYFNNYPSVEYGTLSATVLKIAPLPTEKQYEVLLELPTEWITNYDITIPKQQKMGATVAIQTKEYTLLERIFAGLTDALAN